MIESMSGAKNTYLYERFPEGCRGVDGQPPCYRVEADVQRLASRVRHGETTIIGAMLEAEELAEKFKNCPGQSRNEDTGCFGSDYSCGGFLVVHTITSSGEPLSQSA